MSNRILSLFILVLIIGGIYFFYYYYFIINKGNLTLNGNIGGYEVFLYTDKLKTTFSSKCEFQKCELIDIAPFEYKLTIKKDGYKDFYKDIKINKKETLNLNFNLEKQIKIEKIDNENIKEEINIKDKNIELEKFKLLTSMKKNFLFYDLKELGYFYFKENENDTLSLFQNKNGNEILLYNFLKTNKKNIDLQKVYHDDDFLFISHNENKYIYNLQNGRIVDFLFPQKVNYVKKDKNIFSLVNEKGVFLYDINNNKIEYFYLFKDFIFYDENNYLGVIFRNEKDKLKNYNLKRSNNNLIVKYNFNTREIKILDETSIDIKKIIKKDNKIYFLDNSENKYLVNNIE